MGRPSLSTKTGDKGSTGLLGGKRVSKASDRLHAYGTVDELNTILGMILADRTLPELIADDIVSIQCTLFCIGSDLATPMDSDTAIDRVQHETIEQLEERGAILESQLTPLSKFILPGGSSSGALFHHARTVCRRAERWTVALSEYEDVSEHVIVYLNRLGDYFFLAARFTNKHAGTSEQEWNGEPH
tara:strand:+ start:2349 stop:2909 length:561 start_codon:yes stop_codon:yes gene_type:complete